MGVCLVACGYGQFTGLCVFGALCKVATIMAFAGLRVNNCEKCIHCTCNTTDLLQEVDLLRYVTEFWKTYNLHSTHK